MSWVCPICSNPNEDGDTNCFVCGEKRPAASTSSKAEVSEYTSSKLVDVADEEKECHIFYSDSEAFWSSIKRRIGKVVGKIRGIFKKKADKEKKDSVKKEKKKSKVPILLKTSDFTETWPEHKLKFDISVIREKGYVRSEQKELGGVKGYLFFREDGSSQFIRAEMLIIQKMAHKR